MRLEKASKKLVDVKRKEKEKGIMERRHIIMAIGLIVNYYV